MLGHMRSSRGRRLTNSTVNILKCSTYHCDEVNCPFIEVSLSFTAFSFKINDLLIAIYASNVSLLMKKDVTNYTTTFLGLRSMYRIAKSSRLSHKA